LLMLKANRYTKKLLIHEDFPKDLLVSIFRPFLYYYFVTNYDIRGTQRILIYKNILYSKLEGFYKYNRTFGRKINHRKPKCLSKLLKWKPYSFITHHIPFHGIKICNDTFNYYYDVVYQTVNDNSDDSEDDTDTTTQAAIIHPRQQQQVQSVSDNVIDNNDDIDDNNNNNNNDNDDIDDILDDISIS